MLLLLLLYLRLSAAAVSCRYQLLLPTVSLKSNVDLLFKRESLFDGGGLKRNEVIEQKGQQR